MNISVNEKAKKFINEKTQDNCINIAVARVGVGWSSSYQPLVRMGKPKNEKDFKSYKVNDINVYMAKNLMGNHKVNITLSKFLWLKSLQVEGLKI